MAGMGWLGPTDHLGKGKNERSSEGKEQLQMSSPLRERETWREREKFGVRR
jgi:hypothetical protein